MSNLLNSPQMLIRLNHDIMTSVNAIEGDTGRLWHFVIDDYEIPTDATTRLYIEKPSGKKVYLPGIVDGSIVTFQPTLQTLAEVGQAIGQVQIAHEKRSITSYPFFLTVSKNYVLHAGIESTDEFLVLDELIDDAQKCIAEMKSLIQTVTSQENERVEAEKQRQETLKNILTAADNANDAAQNANNKAALADRAKELATQAATKANDAAQNALDAIDSLNGAVGGIINDSLLSMSTTYSSNKITSLFAEVNVKAITNSQIDSLKNL